MLAPARPAPPQWHAYPRCYECGRPILGPQDGGPGPVVATVAVAHMGARATSFVRRGRPFHPRCLSDRIGRHHRRARVLLAFSLVAAVGLAVLAWWMGTTPLVGAVIAIPCCYAAWLEATDTRTAG